MNALGLILSIAILHLSAAADEFRAEINSVAVAREGNYFVSQWTEVTIPDGLASFQILITGDSSTLVQITDLIAPDGTHYVVSANNKTNTINQYSNPLLSNTTSQNRSVTVVASIGSLIVPNNPHLPAPLPGIWKFRALSHFEPKIKLVSFVIVGKSKAELSKSAIDIRVWVSPDSYWTSKPELVGNLIAEAKGIFKTEANLDLNPLAVNLLPKRPSTPMVLPEDTAKVARDHNDPNVINVYLMPTMEYQNNPINGLACIGGPVGSLSHHGCFVSMYAADTGADTISHQSQAKILVHELGHYLGLFHTKDTGFYGINAVYDSLDDTPEEITGLNLMDPGIPNKTPHFSPQQVQMLHLSPALH